MCAHGWRMRSPDTAVRTNTSRPRSGELVFLIKDTTILRVFSGSWIKYHKKKGTFSAHGLLNIGQNLYFCEIKLGLGIKGCLFALGLFIQEAHMFRYLYTV